MLKNSTPHWIWFVGGVFAGLTLIGISHAGISPQAPVIREYTGGKTRISSHLDQEFDRLRQEESRYVESQDQIQRLKRKTLRASSSPSKTRRGSGAVR